MRWSRADLDGGATEAFSDIHGWILPGGLVKGIDDGGMAVLISTVVTGATAASASLSQCRWPPARGSLHACHGRCAHPGERPRHHAAQLLGSLLRCLPDHQEQEEEIAVVLLFLVFLSFFS